jgi:hypothetical protein
MAESRRRRFGGYFVGPDNPASELMAAPRDASWFNHPGHNGGQYHIVADDGGSACRGQMLIPELARSAATLDQRLRCRRNGCKQRWPSDA